MFGLPLFYEALSILLYSRRFFLLVICIIVFGEGYVCYLWCSDKIKITPGRFIIKILRSYDFWGALFIYFLVFGFGTIYSETATQNPNVVFFIPTMGHGRLANWIYGHFLGIVTILVFFIFRLSVSFWFALIGALLVASSPFHLYILNSSPVRDYPRAQFVLIVVALLGFIVRYGNSVFRMVTCTAVIGFVCGFGNHFREDIITYIISSVLTVIFLTPFKSIKAWTLKGIGLITLILFFGFTVPTPLVKFTSGSSMA